MSASGCDLRLEGPVLLEEGLVDPAVVLVHEGEVLWSGPREEAPVMESREELAYGEGIIGPGFVDLHVHGAAGHDVIDGSLDALEEISRAHADHGTTALCAAVLSSPPAVMLRALESVGEATAGPVRGARILGAHLEGPFLNPERAGAQPREHLRRPDRALLEELLAAAGGQARIVTLAPELPGALDLVALLVERGIVVAMGHSAATHKEAVAAIDAGARLATHAFNAMGPLHHRKPGLVGAVLQDRRVTAEVIADGVHVSGPVLELLWRLKGPDRLCPVTDCTAALCAPPGEARLGQQSVQVKDGAVRLADGTLAGSSLTMDRAVGTMVELGRASLEEAVRAASQIPARVLGLNQLGTLVQGARADLVHLDREERLQDVLVGGVRVT
jgi:N-acetylglucosamine-6-phosphate deacetylase